MNYLTEYADIDFPRHPFTAVDALALCQMAYLKTEGIVPADSFITFREMFRHADSEKMYEDRLFGEIYREFMKKMAEAERYKDLEAGLYEEAVSEQEEYQFAAVTFRAPKDRHFVAFRGTDEKLVGWKEDFNMGYMQRLPSQEIALAYLNKIPGKGAVFVGGHSKGGSQAVYAAAKADRRVKNRISAVFSFDGMGLGEEFYSSKEYEEIRGRVTKIIPEESVIGTLFERPENCLVVRSEGIGIKQHDFMNWNIRDGHFEYCDSLKPAARHLADRLNKWIISLDAAEKEHFVGSIYSLVMACHPDEIYSLQDEAVKKVITVINELRSMDDHSRREMRGILLKLIKA